MLFEDTVPFVGCGRHKAGRHDQRCQRCLMIAHAASNVPIQLHCASALCAAPLSNDHLSKPVEQRRGFCSNLCAEIPRAALVLHVPALPVFDVQSFRSPFRKWTKTDSRRFLMTRQPAMCQRWRTCRTRRIHCLLRRPTTLSTRLRASDK